MNRLPLAKRSQVIALLVEGMSMREVLRLAHVSINTVTKQLEAVGTACAEYLDEHVRSINAKRVQCDEIWAFCHNKRRNVAPENKDVLGFGDVYTWTGVDPDSKLMVSYMVGKRDVNYANAFIEDLAARLTSRVQLSTDGHKPYLEAVGGASGSNVDYASLVDYYGPGEEAGKRRYSPAEFVSPDGLIITGNPNMDEGSTGFVERQNLTMRMGMCRFTRLTDSFSKKVENLEHAVSLHIMHYNFACIHKTLRVTPAMQAGIADHVWSLEEIAELVPAPVAKKRGSYKPRRAVI